MLTSKHINKYCFAVLLIFTFLDATAQFQSLYIDSIRNEYHIPAIGYAVITGDSIIELRMAGQPKVNSDNKILLANRFHIGSNTKAITSFIASDLVQQGLLHWNTSLFYMFPEFRGSHKQRDITFSDLLNFKVPLAPFSYNTEIPNAILAGKTEFEQRYQIAKYLLKQKPVDKTGSGLYLTNTGYVLAGLMMEKASGKNYYRLVNDAGIKLGIDFQFGNPNKSDKNQTYGHDENSNPINDENIRLNWLLSAGNINLSLIDYAKFIQFFLQAIEGKSKLYAQQKAKYLLTGNTSFSFGWFEKFDETIKTQLYYNFGNANGFMSSVIIIKEKGIAIVVLANKSSVKAEEGINEITSMLKNKYNR